MTKWWEHEDRFEKVLIAIGLLILVLGACLLGVLISVTAEWWLQ